MTHTSTSDASTSKQVWNVLGLVTLLSIPQLHRWYLTGATPPLVVFAPLIFAVLSFGLPLVYPRAARRALLTFSASVLGALTLIEWAGPAENISRGLSLTLGLGAFAFAFYTATRPTPTEAEPSVARAEPPRSEIGLTEREHDDVRALVASGLSFNDAKHLVERRRDQV